MITLSQQGNYVKTIPFIDGCLKEPGRIRKFYRDESESAVAPCVQGEVVGTYRDCILHLDNHSWVLQRGTSRVIVTNINNRPIIRSIAKGSINNEYSGVNQCPIVYNYNNTDTTSRS